jgi:AcrR family transcriptional regulator
MQERAQITRQALLETAADLFDRFGYTGTSISRICELADCTAGAVYFHFQGKPALAQAVVEGHFARWPALIGQYTSAGGPVLDRLVALSYAVGRAFRDEPLIRGGARLWHERHAIPVPLPPPFADWIDTLAELLEQAAADGELAPGTDPAATAGVLVAAFHGLHTVSDALTGRGDIEQRLDEFWVFSLKALRPAMPAMPRARHHDPQRRQSGATSKG